MDYIEKKIHWSRRFLNKEGDLRDSSIISSITLTSNYRVSADIDLRIRDCNNTIFFELDLYDEGEDSFDNSIHKLDSLIQELTLLKVKMKQAKPIYDQMFADKKKEEEKEEEERKNRREEQR